MSDSDMTEHEKALRIDLLGYLEQFGKDTSEIRDRFHKGEMTIRERIQEQKKLASRLAGDLAGLL